MSEGPDIWPKWKSVNGDGWGVAWWANPSPNCVPGR